mmetsp:Transcript_46064/g.142097  ORF Transcript_46064/g.142097 Transcript_46064/m.142097 type:complete len:474 (+) Transcript_46064:126-1547(+)
MRNGTLAPHKPPTRDTAHRPPPTERGGGHGRDFYGAGGRLAKEVRAAPRPEVNGAKGPCEARAAPPPPLSHEVRRGGAAPLLAALEEHGGDGKDECRGEGGQGDGRGRQAGGVALAAEEAWCHEAGPVDARHAEPRGGVLVHAAVAGAVVVEVELGLPLAASAHLLHLVAARHLVVGSEAAAGEVARVWHAFVLVGVVAADVEGAQLRLSHVHHLGLHALARPPLGVLHVLARLEVRLGLHRPLEVRLGAHGAVLPEGAVLVRHAALRVLAPVVVDRTLGECGGDPLLVVRVAALASDRPPEQLRPLPAAVLSGGVDRVARVAVCGLVRVAPPALQELRPPLRLFWTRSRACGAGLDPARLPAKVGPDEPVVVVRLGQEEVHRRVLVLVHRPVVVVVLRHRVVAEELVGRVPLAGLGLIAVELDMVGALLVLIRLEQPPPELRHRDALPEGLVVGRALADVLHERHAFGGRAE